MLEHSAHYRDMRKSLGEVTPHKVDDLLIAREALRGHDDLGHVGLVLRGDEIVVEER